VAPLTTRTAGRFGEVEVTGGWQGIHVRHDKPALAAGLVATAFALSASSRRRRVRCAQASCALRAAKKAGLSPGKTPKAKIRNFAIIAHIDHGKSTLADRLLEQTGTVKKEDMQAQIMDTMDIERERGITIKLNSARMNVKGADGEDYVLNLIDTPGHVDFTYEVSRSLAACEGAILVVDATQGVEAQTLANVTLAMENELYILPVLNKVDLPTADIDRISQEIEEVLGIDCTEALPCSAKTGVGVGAIIQAVIDRIPAPSDESSGTDASLRALIYDSYYDNYLGVVAYFRVFEGTIKKGQKIRFMASSKEFLVAEVGTMIGNLKLPCQELSAGEVGYVAAAIKTVADARVGDTIIKAGEQDKLEALPGYTDAVPMVFCGLFPDSDGSYDDLKIAFERLALSDAALSFEPEKSEALGLGFRCGFLGILHMEVITERLEREFGIDLVVTAPSVEYQIDMKDGGTELIRFANELPSPAFINEIREPYVALDMMVPEEHIGAVMNLTTSRRGIYKTTNFMSQGRVLLNYEMPMGEMIRDFFSELKATSRGYASLEYRILNNRPNDLVKLEIDINKTTAPPLSQIVHRSRALELAKKCVNILQEEIPPQQIVVIIQARIGAQILNSGRIKAVRKDVLAKCYGGDVSRKKKLLQKQAKGKKKMQAIGKVNVPSEAILQVIKKT